jgi:hypothetical protein
MTVFENRTAAPNAVMQLFHYRIPRFSMLAEGLFYHKETCNFVITPAGYPISRTLWTQDAGLIQSYRQYFKRVLYHRVLSGGLAGFRWYRFVLFSGLGYKRRLSKTHRIMFIYIADRHWLGYRLQQGSTIVGVRRRNFIFYAPAKAGIAKTYDFFTSLRKPNIYKTKGFLDTRVRAKFLFVRRLKIRGLRIKLSKKQKML